MIAVHVKDQRSGTETLGGLVVNSFNVPARGDVRLLKLLLDTGYQLKLYATKEEIQELLASFPEEAA